MSARILNLMLISTLVMLIAGCGETEQETDVGVEPEAAQERETIEVQPMTGEDGWVELHDLDIPAAGRAVLRLDDVEVSFDIDCLGPGVIEAHHDLPAFLEHLLFRIGVRGLGELDGQEVLFEAARNVVDSDKAQEDLRFHRYPGQDRARIRFVITLEDGLYQGSEQRAPGDRNREGHGLPLLHVQPDGSFTAMAEVPASPGHDQALAGDVILAGRCPAPWNELEGWSG